MPLGFHTWLKQEHLRDYAQTVTLAKLQSNCGCAKGKRCVRCTPLINRELRKLFMGLYPLIRMDLSPENQRNQRERLRREEAHRRFLAVLDAKRKGERQKLNLNMHAKGLKVSHWLVKKWLDLERSKKGDER